MLFLFSIPDATLYTELGFRYDVNVPRKPQNVANTKPMSATVATLLDGPK